MLCQVQIGNMEIIAMILVAVAAVDLAGVVGARPFLVGTEKVVLD